MTDFIVETKKLSTVSYLLVAGASSKSAAMQIATRYSVAFGNPLSARPVSDDSPEPEPAISLYLTGDLKRTTAASSEERPSERSPLLSRRVMDEKHSNHLPRHISTPAAVQAQPAQVDAEGVSSTTGGADNPRTEKSDTANNPASSTKPEAAKQSGGLATLLGAWLAPRAISTPAAVQAQPAQADTEAVSSNPGGTDDSGTEESGRANNPAPSTKPEIAKESGSLRAVLEASRAELHILLAETQSIHERSWQIIHKLLEDSQLTASQIVDTCLARFENEIQDRINSEMSMILQNFDVEAGARLAARLDQGLATAEQRQHSIEQDLATAVAENRKQLDQISTGAADGLRQQVQSQLTDLQKEADRRIGELAENAHQIRNDIQQLADNLGTELKKSTDQAVKVFQSRIEQTWQEIVARTEKKIAETADTHTTELAKQAREAVDREMSEFLSHTLRRFSRSSGALSSNQST